jgi:hypothetical protein
VKKEKGGIRNKWVAKVEQKKKKMMKKSGARCRHSNIIYSSSLTHI